MGRNKLEITADRERAFVMPPYIEEWVDKTHPARFIDAIVENLDLESLGFKKRTSKKGRPNYSNKMMLKIILYAHFCKIRTLRAIERMVHNDMGMLWLTGMNYPDHNTISFKAIHITYIYYLIYIAKGFTDVLA